MNKYDKEYYKQNKQNDDRIALWFYARYLKKYLKSGDVLDYGCGTGHLIKRFGKQYNTYGFEISNFAKSMAANNSPRTIFINTLDDVSDFSLDMIISLHVFEHLDNHEQVFLKLNKKLKSDGLLFLVVPNKSALGYKLKKEKWFAFKDPTHISLFEKDEWVNIVKNAGFNIFKLKTDGLWDSPYLKYIPNFIQKFFFSILPSIQVITNTLFIPWQLGEDLIIIAKKQN